MEVLLDSLKQLQCVRKRPTKEPSGYIFQVRKSFENEPDEKGVAHRFTDTGTNTGNCLKRRPSEDYGNEEHTTVAAFLPWRGS